MNTLIVFSAILALGLAAPAQQGVSLSQDTLGNYNLRYATSDSQRDEEGFQDGKVVGSYSYHDKEGVLHKVTYVAAPNAGFVASGDVPTQVQETPEVAAARAHHLAIVERERAILPPLKEEHQEVVFVPSQPAFHVPTEQHFQVPQFVQHQQSSRPIIDNTAELEAAKAEHFAAHKQALDRLAEEYSRLSNNF